MEHLSWKRLVMDRYSFGWTVTSALTWGPNRTFFSTEVASRYFFLPTRLLGPWHSAPGTGCGCSFDGMSSRLHYYTVQISVRVSILKSGVCQNALTHLKQGSSVSLLPGIGSFCFVSPCPWLN